ncbi:hypothetical protein [Candidatus Spongiihabitans sp.]
MAINIDKKLLPNATFSLTEGDTAIKIRPIYDYSSPSPAAIPI